MIIFVEIFARKLTCVWVQLARKEGAHSKKIQEKPTET